LFKEDEPGIRAKIEMVLSPSGADMPPQRTPEREALAAAHAAQLMSQKATMDGPAKGIHAHEGKYRVRLTLNSAGDMLYLGQGYPSPEVALRITSLYLVRLEEERFDLAYILGRPQAVRTTCTPEVMEYLASECPTLTPAEASSLQQRAMSTKYRLYRSEGARYRRQSTIVDALTPALFHDFANACLEAEKQFAVSMTSHFKCCGCPGVNVCMHADRRQGLSWYEHWQLNDYDHG